MRKSQRRWCAPLLALGSLSACGEPSAPVVVPLAEAGLARVPHMRMAERGPDDEPVPAPLAVDRPRFHEHVRPILQRRCETCHREGGVAPFALVEHDAVHGRRAMIRLVLEERSMPPWPAAGEGWVGDLRLEDWERELLLAWIDADGPEGAPAAAPPERAWPADWTIGEPDLVLEMSTPLHIPAEGVVDYRFSTIPFPLEEDVWVQAVEVLADHPRANHHVFVHLLDADGEEQFLAGLLPGQSVMRFPDGMARRIPKEFVTVRFQHHLTPFGEEAWESTRVGLVFADRPPERAVRSGKFGTVDLSIPPHDPDHEVVVERVLHKPLAIRSLLPHMHLRGREATVDADLPDGRRVRLLHVPRWDPDWQLQYAFEELPVLPAGTTLRLTGLFDNSAGNPSNPDPSRRVPWGEQIWDEMLSLYVEFVDP